MTEVKKAISILLIGTIVGIGLLAMAFSLPSLDIENNVKNSLVALQNEGLWPLLEDGKEESRLDNWTDSLMINNSFYTNDDYNLLEQVTAVPRAEDGISPLSSLEKYVNNPEDESIRTDEYSRYWHGYIVFLRPLLLVMNYTTIRKLLAIVHILLLLAFLIISMRKLGKLFSAAFLISYLCVFNNILFYSLQYSTIIIISLVTASIQLLLNDYLERKKFTKYFFLLVGMITVYFDFLTYPIATLGINLIVYCITNKEKDVIELLKLCFFWLLGYGGFWILKWLFAVLVLGFDQFKDVVETVSFRLSQTGDEGIKITRFETLSQNICLLFNKTTILLILLFYVITIGCKLIKNKKRIKISFDKNLLFKLLFIASLPIVWILVLTNHSSIHFYFTYRCLIAMLLVILLLPLCIKTGDIE